MAVTAVTETVTETVQILSAVTETSPLRQFRRRNRNRNRNSVGLYFSAHRRDRVTPLLEQLHWLPVRERIDHKLLQAMRARVSLPKQHRTGLSGKRLSTGVRRRIKAAAPLCRNSCYSHPKDAHHSG